VGQGLAYREQAKEFASDANGDWRDWFRFALLLGSPFLAAAITIGLGVLVDRKLIPPSAEDVGGPVVLWGNAVLAVAGSATGAALMPLEPFYRILWAVTAGVVSLVAHAAAVVFLGLAFLRIDI
jgi:hypothetical protein